MLPLSAIFDRWISALRRLSAKGSYWDFAVVLFIPVPALASSAPCGERLAQFVLRCPRRFVRIALRS